MSEQKRTGSNMRCTQVTMGVMISVRFGSDREPSAIFCHVMSTESCLTGSSDRRARGSMWTNATDCNTTPALHCFDAPCLWLSVLQQGCVHEAILALEQEVSSEFQLSMALLYTRQTLDIPHTLSSKRLLQRPANK